MIIGDAESRAQAQASAGKKFDELDVDNDGVVSPEELMGILEDSESISEKDKKGAADLLAALDLDGDGKVDRNDWVKAFGQIFDFFHSQKPVQASPAAKHAKVVEFEAKLNNDNESKDKNASKKKDSDSGDEGDDDESDESSEESSEEENESDMAHIIRESKSKKEAEANASNIFDELDTGKKGSVNANEILKLIDEDQGRSVSDLVQKEARKLVSALKAKNNGKINRMEWNTVFGSIYEKM